MRNLHLRMDPLRTKESAAAYLPHWVRHIKRLELFGVETDAFFSVPSTLHSVVSLISFDEHADPEVVTREYMRSDTFKHNMADFDVVQIRRRRYASLYPRRRLISDLKVTYCKNLSHEAIQEANSPSPLKSAFVRSGGRSLSCTG